jgi:hypothetical protein
MDDGALSSSPEAGAAVIEPAEAAPAPAPPPTPPGMPALVYAIGQLEPRFPSVAIEKEFAQAIARSEAAGTDRTAFYQALHDPANRYIARRLCWVFAVAGIETYILVPRDPADLTLLFDSYQAELHADRIDVVIGRRGPIAQPEMCNGLTLPVVVFEQLYSFKRRELVDAIPMPDDVEQGDHDAFRSSASETFDQILRGTDNAGATDEHRAINYLAVRYPRLYAKTAQMHQRNYAFTGIDAERAPLSGARSLIDVVVSFRSRSSDELEQHAVRVDVTEEYPFLAGGGMSRYFGR